MNPLVASLGIEGLTEVYTAARTRELEAVAVRRNESLEQETARQVFNAPREAIYRDERFPEGIAV